MTPQPNTSKLPVILLVLVSLISLSGFVYFYIQTQSLKQQLTSQPSPTPTQSTRATQPSPVTNSTANWQKYNNDKYGVSIKYPHNWYNQTLSDWSFNTAFDDHNFVIPEGTEFLPTISLAFNEYMDTRDNTYHFTETTVEEALSRYKESVYGENIQEKQIAVGNHKAYQLNGKFGPGMLEGQFYKTTLIQMSEKVLVFTLTKEQFEDIYDQMLDTLTISASQ